MRRFAIAVLVVDLLACDPGYQSGKTKCSNSGTCPSGYECVGGVCAAPKDALYCRAQSSDSSCTACDRSACCSEIITCLDNTSCSSLVDCLGNCTTSSCKTTCKSTYSAGNSANDDWDVCLNNQCYAACSTPSSTGGSGGSGGSGSGGTGGGGTTSGGALVKFCHGLTQGGSSVTLTLNLNGTKISTTTGNCAPVTACQQVAVGSSVPISLLNGSTTLVSGTINITAGTEYLVRGRLDSNSSPMLSTSVSAGICSGGTGTSGTLGKFCNYLQVSHADFTATLKIGSATFTAKSNTCSPVGSCTSISSGTNVSLSLLNGSTSIISGTYPTITSGANMIFTAEIDESDNSPTVYGSNYPAGICSVASGTSPDIVGGSRPWAHDIRKQQVIREATSEATSADQSSSASGVYYESELRQAVVRDRTVPADPSLVYGAIRQ
jgi:hypothetical protein